MKLQWNYTLADNEKIDSIEITFTRPKKNPVPLADKTVNNKVNLFPYGKDKPVYKRYNTKSQFEIYIDDVSRVELTLKQVQISEDDKVSYAVVFNYVNKWGGDQVEKSSTIVNVVGKEVSCISMYMTNGSNSLI